jgi:hypothetical protein
LEGEITSGHRQCFSLINEKDIPKGTAIHECKLNMLSSNGHTTPVTHYVIGTVIDPYGQRSEFLCWLQKIFPTS